MKFSKKNILLCCWIVANLLPFVVIGTIYCMTWHYSKLQNSISTADAQFIAHSASKEQLAQLFLDEDASVRGVLKEVFLILNCWFGITLGNVFIASICFYLFRHKAESK